MKTKLEVVRYIENDVVATSACPKTGMSQTSYQLNHYSCGWTLSNAKIDSKSKGNIIYSYGEFTYFNETGSTTTVLPGYISSPLIGTYFHFDGNGNFEICTNSDHHYQEPIKN